MDIEETFRLAIKARIEQVGHGEQARIARKSGVNTSTLSNILSGARGSKEWQRRAIADAAGMNYEDIVGQVALPLSKATGTADIETHHATPAHQSGADPPPPPPAQDEDDKLPTAPQAIEMTRAVLASRTIYRGALLQNIKAFHKAVQGEQEMTSLRDDMQDMKKQMAAMQAMMARIERNTAAALPVETPAQKREVQGG